MGPREHADVETEVLELGEARRVRAGGVEARTGIAWLGRGADDAGVDEGRAGRRDGGGDALHRRRAHRVAVDEHRLAVAGGERGREPLRQRDRVAGRQDGQDEIGCCDLLVAGGHHAGGLGARGRLGAAALERGQHLEAVIGEPLSDGSAHHPRRDDGDDRIHAWSPMGARLSDLTTSLHPGKVRRQGGRASAVAPDDQGRRDDASAAWQPGLFGLCSDPRRRITRTALHKAGNEQWPKIFPTSATRSHSPTAC